MNCPRCQAENPPGAKFCSSCGSMIENVCGACRASVQPDDRFCGSCGKPVLKSADENPLLESNSAKQYSKQDIEELLSLRRQIRKEETATKTLNQDDVDKLFG